MHKISVSTVPCTNCVSIFIPMKSWSRWFFGVRSKKKNLSGAPIIVFTSYIRHIWCSVVCSLYVLPLVLYLWCVVLIFFRLLVVCVVACFMLNIPYIGDRCLLCLFYVCSMFIPFAVYFCWFLLKSSSFNLTNLTNLAL